MAEVMWNKLAIQEWRNRLLYGLNEFGETSAIHFVQRTNDIIDRIRKHPEIGYPEPFERIIVRLTAMNRAALMLPPTAPSPPSIER